MQGMTTITMRAMTTMRDTEEALSRVHRLRLVMPGSRERPDAMILIGIKHSHDSLLPE
jgi:hypothetical protein